MFIDEAWASTNMATCRGRASKGELLRAAISHFHWKTTVFMAGLRWTGMVEVMALDGLINSRSFQTWVYQVLIPKLKPGDIVVTDNPGSHKGPGVRAAIEAAGARLLYLLPYSPDFNPFERLPKHKAPPGKAAERSVNGLWATIARIATLIELND